MYRSTPSGYAIRVGGAELLEGLDPSDWPNAVATRRTAQERCDAVAAVTMQYDAVVGVASASTDSDTLWQIGIDVHSEHRGVGLGAALTSQVARGVLDEGRVPYYGSSVNQYRFAADGAVGGVLSLLGVSVYDGWVAWMVHQHRERNDG